MQSARHHTNHKHRQTKAQAKKRRRNHVSAGMAAMAAGLTLLNLLAQAQSVQPSVPLASSNSPAEVDAEIQRLQQALEEARKRRAKLDQSAPPSAPPATPPGANAPAAQETNAELGAVVVRARNREEKLQDIPIPVSVLSGRELERDGAVNISDFARKATNVQAAELNSRRSSVSIRGVGKNTTGEEFEAPVGVIIDNVFQAYVGSSWTNFVDIDRIEVARGPQGTLLGKNTTLGVLNITTKLPSFKPGYTFESTAGSRDTLKLSGSATNAIVDGLLAYRASFFSEKGDGSIKSTLHNESTWYDRNRQGGRLQFLLTPSEDVSARFILEHAQARENINMSPEISDPARFSDAARTVRPITASSRYARSWFGGYVPLGQRFAVDADYVTPSIDRQSGASAEVNWDIGSHTLTSITAWRNNLFVADNDFDKTRFDVRRGGGARTDQRQISEELRLTSKVGGPIDYQTGLYLLRNEYELDTRTTYGADAGAFYATAAQYATLDGGALSAAQRAAGRLLLRDSLNNVTTRNPRKPETTSVAVFGQANWHFSEKGTLTLGLRETWEKKTNAWNYLNTITGADLDAAGAAYGASAAQIAAAKAIRSGQLGATSRYAPQSISDTGTSTSVLLNPSYKLTPDTLLYTSVARGVKSGAVSFNSADGVAYRTNPETALDFELGFKTLLLNRKLVLNTNLFHTNIKDFQTNLVVQDPTAVGGIRTLFGNVPKVRLQGIEIDGAFTPSAQWTVRFGGAISDSTYRDFKSAPCPPELNAAASATCDFSGRTLPGAPKYSANIGVEFRQPIKGSYLFHANLDNAYTSKQNVSLGLSEAGTEPARNIAAIGFGVSTLDGKYDLSLNVRNLFDKIYSVDTSGYTTTSAVSTRWGERRFIGLTFRARL